MNKRHLNHYFHLHVCPSIRPSISHSSAFHLINSSRGPNSGSPWCSRTQNLSAQRITFQLLLKTSFSIFETPSRQRSQKFILSLTETENVDLWHKYLHSLTFSVSANDKLHFKGLQSEGLQKLCPFLVKGMTHYLNWIYKTKKDTIPD